MCGIQAACKVQCQPELWWRLYPATSISSIAPLPCSWSQHADASGCIGQVALQTLASSHVLDSLCQDMVLFEAGAVLLSPCRQQHCRCAEANCKVRLPARAVLHFPAGISSIAYVLDSFVAGAITWMAAVSFKAAASAETRQQLPHVFQVLQCPPICHAT